MVPGSTLSIPARDATWVANAARLTLVAAAVALGAFQAFDFRRDNDAPVFDASGHAPAAPGQFAVHVARCQGNGKKIVVEGWVAPRGQRRGARTVQVVVVEDDGNAAYRLDTRLRDDPAAATALAERFGAGNYAFSGFGASLDMEASGRAMRPGRLHVAYADATMRVLVPLPCRIPA